MDNSYRFKLARGPNNKYLVDRCGNYLPCMYDIVSYYFREIYLPFMLSNKRKGK